MGEYCKKDKNRQDPIIGGYMCVEKYFPCLRRCFKRLVVKNVDNQFFKKNCFLSKDFKG